MAGRAAVQQGESAMKKWFDRWHRQQRKMKVGMRGTYIYRTLGRRLLQSHLWAMDRGALAGGLSLGLFVAFTPTIPFQMLTCAIGALIFRVNLPIAWVACWITNPATIIPFYAAWYRIGEYMFGRFDFLSNMVDGLPLRGAIKQAILGGIYLWAGSMTFALPGALAGHVIVRLAWFVAGRVRPASEPGDEDADDSETIDELSQTP
jgi:hypothetical protein